MSEAKVYYLDEARDAIAKAKREFVDGKDEELIYNMVNCLIRGRMPKDAIHGYLQNISILCDPIIMTQETYDMIDKSIELCCKNRQEINLTQDVRDFVLSSNGKFLSRDVYNCLGVSSRKDKKTVSWGLMQCVKEGLIEKCGSRNGEYRPINKTVDKINWKKGSGKEIDLLLPLHLNELVKIYPKNLIVVAGMSNAGKTAILLNIAGLNIDIFKDKLHYFSSEMGEDELCLRLRSFKLPDNVWDGCNFLERSSDFADVIDPDGINLIDYFEINDNFWAIGGDFKAIYDKLEKGIAIIALQKHPEKDEGSGGRFSLEKPRLYLSLNEIGDYNELKIVKCKNWRDIGLNPNKLIKNFKIREGCQLIELGNWHKEEK